MTRGVARVEAPPEDLQAVGVGLKATLKIRKLFIPLDRKNAKTPYRPKRGTRRVHGAKTHCDVTFAYIPRGFAVVTPPLHQGIWLRGPGTSVSAIPGPNTIPQTIRPLPNCAAYTKKSASSFTPDL